MIYLDYGATSFSKPPQVRRAVAEAMASCASPGRGGYPQAMEAAERVYACREEAAALFDCDPERVVFTMNGTHGLNIAIRSLVRPGARVVISGFEHNAVTRPLYALGARVTVAGRRLFAPEDTLHTFREALRGAEAAVFTHVSNVFGYILPVEELAALCREAGVPFIVDAAQSAGSLPVSLRKWGADFIAMPGHKGLLGPQGTGLLLCGREGEPLLYGGTGVDSISREMPRELPERLEPGTVNVPGIAGLTEGLRYVRRIGTEEIFRREHRALRETARRLRRLGMRVFSGESQAGVLSFLCGGDCEEAAAELARAGVALRAGLHCAPLAHESAGTQATGTLRASFGWDTDPARLEPFFRAVTKLPPFRP